jgi:DNA polymerase-1
MTKKVLIIDGYNMIHRARFEWGSRLATGENQIIYNFFRLLKSSVEMFSPDVVYFPLDGKPVKRLELYEDYKANRIEKDPTKEEIAYWESFHNQKRKIINLLRENHPVRVMYHPEQEGDDLVYFAIKQYHYSDDVVILSSDTDFIQILNEFPDNVSLYNPIAKKYRENTEYDYVSWKAMVGDKADNIPGVKGIGKKTAEKILLKKGGLDDRLADLNFKSQYEKSYELIKFADLSDIKDQVIISSSELDIDSIESAFYNMGFNSMVKESYLDKYKKTFSSLEV